VSRNAAGAPPRGLYAPICGKAMAGRPSSARQAFFTSPAFALLVALRGLPRPHFTQWSNTAMRRHQKQFPVTAASAALLTAIGAAMAQQVPMPPASRDSGQRSNERQAGRQYSTDNGCKT